VLLLAGEDITLASIDVGVLIVVEMEPGVVGLENEKTLLIYAKWRSLN
jgi:hypothetical protein